MSTQQTQSSRLLTEMSVAFAHELMVAGWSINGEWLVLAHDEAGQVWRVQVHNSAGCLWASVLPYTDPLDCIDARAGVLNVGARWSLFHSDVLRADRAYRPTEAVMARLAERATPLVGALTCKARRPAWSVCVGGNRAQAPLRASCEAPRADSRGRRQAYRL